MCTPCIRTGVCVRTARDKHAPVVLKVEYEQKTTPGWSTKEMMVPASLVGVWCDGVHAGSIARQDSPYDKNSYSRVCTYCHSYTILYLFWVSIDSLRRGVVPSVYRCHADGIGCGSARALTNEMVPATPAAAPGSTCHATGRCRKLDHAICSIVYGPRKCDLVYETLI